MSRLLLAALIAAAAAALAWWLQRRRPPAPTQAGFSAPTQLDRADFPRPEARWLVAVFTSASCGTCADTTMKAAALESDTVAVAEVEVGAAKALHRRYGIEAVPIVAVADHLGAVRASFVGPVAAAELWAALAELRSAAD
ncbi:MAG: thioredoxin family protein [Acidimicrobiales bacterium]